MLLNISNEETVRDIPNLKKLKKGKTNSSHNIISSLVDNTTLNKI